MLVRGAFDPWWATPTIPPATLLLSLWPYSPPNTVTHGLPIVGGCYPKVQGNWIKQQFLHALPLSCSGNSGLVLGRCRCYSPLPLLWGTHSYGPPSSINVYWVELQGIHALLVALEFFCKQHQIFSGGITIGCDNQGALHQAQQFHKHVPCSNPHVDIIRAITALHLCSQINLTFIYVPGHQDTLTWFKDLSALVRLNVWADALAKKNSTG